VGIELPILSKSTIEVAFSARKYEEFSVLKKPYQSVYKKKSGWKQSSSAELETICNSKQAINSIRRFYQGVKFYGGKYLPAFLEFVKLKYMRSKSRNIRYIGSF
jgi:hypothetical protein